MGMMMAVSFTRYGRLYYLDPGQHSPKVGDKVLVPTESGAEVAECIWAPQYVSEDVERPAGLRGHRRRGASGTRRGQPAAARGVPLDRQDD